MIALWKINITLALSKKQFIIFDFFNVAVNKIYPEQQKKIIPCLDRQYFYSNRKANQINGNLEFRKLLELGREMSFYGKLFWGQKKSKN